MNPGQIIGLGAASVAFLCFVGLLVMHVLAPPPDGQHARKPGRHRDHGETHRGYADDESGPAELHQLGVDPPVTLLHAHHCHVLDEHVVPIGFNVDEPTWDGEHGESDHPDAVAEQCMCGHPSYYNCPDWATGWETSDLCHQGEHGQCDGIGLDREYGASVANTCPCVCHAIPLSAAIKQQRNERTQAAIDFARDRRDRLAGS